MSGRYIVITGGTAGIGSACSRKFLNEGDTVLAVYSKNEDRANSFLSSVTSLPGKLFLLKSDVCSPDFCDILKSRTDEITSGQGADVIVANAGISLKGLFQDASNEEINRLFSVNLSGVINTIKPLLPDMISKKSGSIVTISSIWGSRGASCESYYSASKGAIESLTKSLAKELGPSGIRVNCVSPGVIDTEMNSSLTEDDIENLKEEISLCRIGNTKEVAEAVYFLSSDNASYITGQILGVDGGYN